MTPMATRPTRFGFVLLVSLVFTGVQLSHAQTKDFNLPAQPAIKGIPDFARQAGVQILVSEKLIRGKQTAAVTGSHSIEEALAILLQGTGLTATSKDGGTYTVVVAPPINPIGGPIHFEIPAESLAIAIQDFSTQSHWVVVAPAALTTGKRSNAVRGTMSPSDALRRLLKASGLTFVRGSDDSITIQAATAGATTADAEGPVAADVSVQSQRDIQVYEPGGNVDVLRTIDDVQPYYIFDSQAIEQSGASNIEDFLKQRLTMNTVSATNSQLAQGGPSILGNTSSINLRGLGLNETLILVNGHRMAGVQESSTTGQPDINGIPLAAIDRIEVLPSSASAIYGGSAMGGVINIILKKNYQGGDIRYTYDNTTATDAPTQTLSATYGFSLEGGKTHVMITGQYSDSTPLLLQDRLNLVDRGIDTILKNDPSFFYSTANPFPGAATNIALSPYPYFNSNFTQIIYTNPQNSTLTLKNGTSLNSLITHLPAGASPTTNLSSALLANAGTYNLNLAPGTGEFALQNEIGVSPRIKSLIGTVSREMTSWLDAFVEVSTVSNASVAMANPFGGSYVVPGNAPTNPFQENVSVTFPLKVSVPVDSDSVTQTVTSGFTFRLPSGWTGETDYTWSQNTYSYDYSSNIDGTAFNKALADGTVNPFVDTITYPPNLAPYLAPYFSSASSTVNDVALRGSGPIFHLPWGDPILTIGLEHRKEGYPPNTTFANDPLTPANDSEYVSFGQTESTNSIYAEAQIPVVTAKNALPGIHSFELQLASRTELYSVRSGTETESFSGSPPVFTGYDVTNANGQPFSATANYHTSTPTFGFKYRPVNDLMFRGSFGKAFLPPTFGQLEPNPNVAVNGAQVVDPKNPGAGPYNVNLLSGGNPNLTPEHSEDWDAGLVFEPKDNGLQGLRADLEYYEITQYGVITSLTPQQIVDDPALADRVIRAPSGLITQINDSLLNAVKYRTKGFDLSADYRKPTSLGTFDLRAMATVIEHDKQQTTLDQPFVDFVGWPGSGGVAKTKANATLTWIYRDWTVAWTTRWFDGYHQVGAPGDPSGNTYPGFVQAQGSTTIPSQMYHDLFASYTFGKGDGPSIWPRRLISDFVIQVGVKNLFNTLPPFDASNANAPYYYSTYGDVKLREYWISARASF